MRRWVRSGAAALVLLSGCTSVASIKYYQYPRNSLAGVEKVAVVPFANYTSARIDMATFSQTLASELVQFPGFTVTRPDEVFARARAEGYALPPATDAESVKLARFLGVDAVLVGGITEYDPYYPPRVALAAQMIGVKRFSLRSVDVDRLVPSGKPFRVDAGRRDMVVAALEKVYDSNWEVTRIELRGYTQAHSGDDHAFPEEDATLRVMERYHRFVSNRMVRALLEQGTARQKADAEAEEKAEREAQERKRREQERTAPVPARPTAG